MLFLVELDHVKSGPSVTPELGRTFIEQVILPTIARGDQLVAERKILAGGPAVGRIALRLIVEGDSPRELDLIVTSLPLWPLAETKITPLVAFADRKKSVQTLLERLRSRAASTGAKDTAP